MTNHPNRSKREVMCQCGNCLDMVGDAGLTITLRTKDRHDEQRAVFCSAYHAALALLRLAQDRGEVAMSQIHNDDGSYTGGLWLTEDVIPRLWKSA